jgi:hypothetical protein
MLVKNKFLLFFVISIGSVIGMVRGEEAKQKWVFKIKSKVDNKKLNASRQKKAVFCSMISRWLLSTTINYPLSENINPGLPGFFIVIPFIIFL